MVRSEPLQRRMKGRGTDQEGSLSRISNHTHGTSNLLPGRRSEPIELTRLTAIPHDSRKKLFRQLTPSTSRGPSRPSQGTPLKFLHHAVASSVGLANSTFSRDAPTDSITTVGSLARPPSSTTRRIQAPSATATQEVARATILS